MRRSVAFSVVLLLAAQIGTRAEAPRPSGVVEEVRVERVLIDVIAEDAEGRPMPGLVRADFTVTLDGDAWPIESVDDLCTTTAPGAAPGDAGATPTPGASAPAPSMVPVRYVLYFDMGQLDQPSRSKSRRRALEWIARKPAAAQAMVIARIGLRFVEEASFTTDAIHLESAVRAAFDDPALFDPFPAQRELRQDHCHMCIESCCKMTCSVCPCETCIQSCRTECLGSAIEELHAVQSSAEMFKVLFGRLARLPGRKELLWFDNSSVLFPARLYEGVTDFDAGDTLRTGESLGSAAVRARTTLWPAFTNHLQYTVNAADFTGAPHARVGTLPEGPVCSYRLALRRTREPDGKQHRVQIAARGRELAGNLQLFAPTPGDLWREAVLMALTAPDAVRDLPVAVALVPAGLRGTKWHVAVELMAGLGALEWRPAGAVTSADWGAGAALSRNGGRDTWDFEKFAAANLPARRETAGFRALHRVELDVPPGHYDLRGFFGDVSAQTTGGARAILELPDPAHGGVAGPVLRAGGRRHILLDLPQRSLRRARARGATSYSVGAEPIVAETLEPGMDVEALAFVCPGRGRSAGAITHALRVGPAGRDTVRALEPGPEVVHDGPCERVTARFRVPADIAPGTRIAYSLNVAEPSSP